MLERVKFFRRRQFVLGPEYINYEGWKKLKGTDDHLLTIHPDLLTTIVEQQENKAILLGYAIDPDHPDLNDEDIIRRFVSGKIYMSTVISGLEKLSGRFVLIVKCPAGLWLFHDACGLRQVQYCRDTSGAIWCASQAETLAEHLGFSYDDEALNYRNMDAWRASKDDFWMINDRTPYREIKNLLPNHYYDLIKGNPFRYWPVPGCIGNLSAKESIMLCSHLLKNSIRAAALRFDLKMGISAGCDSRKSLAAAKDVKDKIYFFTHTPKSTDIFDMEIPARLLPKLGIEHHKLELAQMSTQFKELYETNATWARDKHGIIAYSMLNHIGSEATVLNSNISEYSQVWFWLPKSKINGEGLATLKILNHPFVINEFQKWINGAYSACRTSDMNILVLFDIELRARWVSAAFSEYDIAFETFNPYNNRHLFFLELSVNERLRRGRRLDFPIKLIKNMWPDVLQEPINPENNMCAIIKEYFWRSIVHKTISPWIPIVEYFRYLKYKRVFKRQTNRY